MNVITMVVTKVLITISMFIKVKQKSHLYNTEEEIAKKLVLITKKIMKLELVSKWNMSQIITLKEYIHESDFFIKFNI